MLTASAAISSGVASSAPVAAAMAQGPRRSVAVRQDALEMRFDQPVARQQVG